MEGVKSVVSIGKESEYGTEVTPTISIPVIASDGIQPNQDVVSVEGIRGSAPKNKNVALGKTSYEGGFDMPLYPQAVGYFLMSALGSETPSDLGSSVYKHTFVETIDKTSMTVEQKISTVIRRFTGYVVGGWKISGKAGELLMFNVSGKAKTQSEDTAITPFFETPRAFNFKDVTTLSIGGTDIKAKVEDFEVEYSNGLELFHGLGSNLPAAKFTQQSELNGKMTLYLDSNTKSYFNDLIAGTQREVIIDIVGDTIASALNNELKITLSKCAFTKNETKLDFGYTAVNLEFTAREDTTNGLVKIELTNSVASY